MSEEVQDKPVEPTPVVEPVAEAIPASEPVKLPEEVNTDAAIKKEIDEITKKINVEDDDKLLQLKKEFDAKLEQSKEEIRQNYLNQMTSINKKLDEYSGRKGLVDNQTPNPTIPAVDPVPQEQSEKVDAFAINTISQDDDKELAKKFVESIR